MDQLSAMDAAFLYIESPAQPQHVLGILLLDPEGTQGVEPGTGYSPERFRRALRERLHLMPAFTRRLATVPLNLDHPYWVADPDVDLGVHLQQRTCPAPGDQHALGRLVGELAATPLPRDRPLWRLWLVDGLEHGRVAVVAKLHHATLYGSAGADLMGQLLDLDQQGQQIAPGQLPAAESSPSGVSLVARAAVNTVRRPVRTVRRTAGMARRVGAIGGTLVDVVAQRVPAVLPFSAPRTPMNGPLTPRREVAFSRVPLADLQRVKNAHETKVNDVVLALVTSSLRRYLAARDALPTRPLVASVPKLASAGAVAGTDNLSVLMVPLPVHLDDPVEQLRQIAQSTRTQKDMVDVFGPEMIGDAAEITPPLLMMSGSRLYDALGLSRLHPPLQSLIVSNMPGPPIPLYCAGARVEAVYPFGPLLPGCGLNVTVLSNMGNVDAGLLCCPDLVDDVWEIADGLPAALTTLLETVPAR